MQWLYLNDSLWARVAWLQALDSIAFSNLAKVFLCFFSSLLSHSLKTFLLKTFFFSSSFITPSSYCFFPKPSQVLLLLAQRCLHPNHHHAEVAVFLATRSIQPTHLWKPSPTPLYRDDVSPSCPKKN